MKASIENYFFRFFLKALTAGAFLIIIFDFINETPSLINISVASIFIIYRADLLGGNLQAGDDADAAEFFDLHNLPELAFTSTDNAIKRLQAL